MNPYSPTNLFADHSTLLLRAIPSLREAGLHAMTSFHERIPLARMYFDWRD